MTTLPPGATVVLCEGEKAADAFTAHGIPAVATVCGAASTPSEAALAVLSRFDVVLSPDNDDAGRVHMGRIASALIMLGMRPRLLRLPGLPEKGDAADWVGTTAELLARIEAATLIDAPHVPGAAPIDWPTFWRADHKLEEWLIEPVLPRGRSIALYAPAKAGKSLLMLDLAARAATGQRVLDQPAGEPLSIVYLDLEMTEGDLAERLEDMGFGPESDLSSLHYYQLPNLPPLDTPEGGAAVLAIVRRHHADLVVIDTTSRVLDGPENDADTLRALYINTGLPLKAEGVTVVRLDHAGKDLAKGQRGTSAKNDDVDLVWELTAQDDGIRLRATHRRQSWIPEVVNLIRLEDPLRHKRAAMTWPAGTADLARLLDDLGIPVTAFSRAAREALSVSGRKVRNTTLTAALKYRRVTLESTGSAPGSALFGDAGSAPGSGPNVDTGSAREALGSAPRGNREALLPPNGEALPSPLCRWPNHAGNEWYRDDGSGPVCGVCHPPFAEVTA